MKVTSRDKATSYSTREGAKTVANVLRGLDKDHRTFTVYEITGRGTFQIQVRSMVSGSTGWYAAPEAAKETPMFALTIDAANAAFGPDEDSTATARLEIARILLGVVEQMQAGAIGGPMHDTNGNFVGRFDLTVERRA